MQHARPSPDMNRLLEAILPHVAFEGWSPAAFVAAASDAGMTTGAARAMCPRGAVDLAVAFHKAGDAAMLAVLKKTDLQAMRYSERVAFAVRARLDAVTDKEAVRRGSALFALPHMASQGAALIWGTADAIWTALDDTSTDGNWYSKRATLSAVYAATVLFWLGDDSFGGQATADFIDRRIANVMQVEKFKAQMNANPLLKPVTAPLGALIARIKPPTERTRRDDLPGRWTPQA
jgi:ubiquinone biosynthesis protein COQ9